MKLANKILFILLLFNGLVWGQKENLPQKDTISSSELPEIQLIAQREGILKNVPGSIAAINSIQLLKAALLTANEMLRQITGVQVVDEEGAGLRVNIGIRGLNPDRSRSVLILEDGIPVSLNPYGEPEMYYSPIIDRMSGIEVVKGSGQILFGPQTIGGVINYKTANPPDSQTIRVKLTGGEKGFFSGLASYGTTIGNVGIQTSYLRKQADNLGYTRFRINDISSKIRIAFSARSILGIKLGFYNETSNATYIGLTQTMYDTGNQDFTLMSPDDKLDIRRNSASATHQYEWSKRLKLQTTVFGYTTTRNWRRQDFSATPVANPTGVIWGDTSVTGGAIYMRNSAANRNRHFEVFGVEPRLTYNYTLGKMQNELQVGARYLLEKAYEQRVNGAKYDASAGDMVESEIRTGNAFSTYVQHQLTFSEKLTFTGGFRLEYYDYTRNILRNTFTINNVKSVRDTNIIANSNVLAIIPGMGINFNYLENHTFFAGIHKGFAPPRIKDGITISGEVYNLAPEKSWNLEIGTRGKTNNQALSYEFTAFYLNFRNQIIPVSESSGGVGAGLVNGGKTLHSGFELGGKFDVAKLFAPTYTLALSTNATYTNAIFNADRFVMSNGEKVNIKGNKTPYAPQYMVSSGLNAELPAGLGLQMNALFVGKQFGNELNTVKPSADGRVGLIKAYQVFDANLYYKWNKHNATFNVSVKNLTNERYIVSRRPQGIRVGIARFISAGVDFQF